MSTREVETSDEPSVSVVMATYNRRESLERVVSAVLVDPDVQELVVVVDGADDGSIELLRRIERDDRRLQPIYIENRGPSGALMVGIEHASGDVVLWLDDDVLAEPGLSRAHARHHSETPNLVVMGYMPVRVPTPRAPGDFPTSLYAVEYEAMCERHEREPSRVLMNLWGGHVSMRRADCLRIGLDAPNFPWRYHQDRELGLRLIAAGLTGVFDRSLGSSHLHRLTVESFVRDARAVGASARTVHLLHRDLVGPIDPDFAVAGLPALVAALVCLTRRPRAYSVVSFVLHLAVRAAGRCHAFGLETVVGRLMRRIEMQRGAVHGAGRKGS